MRPRNQAILYISLAVLAFLAGVFMASATARAFIGPDTFVIVKPSGETLGVINGVRIIQPRVEEKATGVGVPTYRLQIEQITPDRWSEPVCPRGMTVLRYGQRGC